MAKKQKIPKMIAGVKVPKSLRRGLRDLAASQTGRQALTEALDAAAVALDAAGTPPPPAKPARKSKAATNGEPEPAGASKAEARIARAAALEGAARDFADAMRRRAPTATAPTPPSAVTH